MKKLIILLCVVLVIGFGSGWLLSNHSDLQVQLSQTLIQPEEDNSTTVPEDGNKLSVTFSKTGTFYGEDIEVTLGCNDSSAKIYYTTDGNDPTEKSKLYKDAISIKSRSKVTATTIKAIAVKDGVKSEITHKSYITGEDVFERFDENTLVFVLSTDEYNLYDYYYGVATEGFLRDEYLNSDEYQGGEIPYNAPANWYISGRESERDMFVEVFTNLGEQIINQACGARVVGGYSRATEQKSWRLIARNMYSEGNGKFKYPFFSGNTDAYGDLITRYDRITLRNNANDREFASIRDELSMTLATMAGFPDTQQTTPAAVFLNSEYYGFSWLHEAYSNDYLEMEYGGIKDNFRIVGAKEKEVEGDDEQCVNDWNYVLELCEKGLVYNPNFEEFCSLVDIDNLMMYYAIQIYIDNKDWPGNNFKVWRYYPSEGEEVDSEYLDGKWRFLLFDAEYAWGLYGAGFKDDTLADVLSGSHMQGDSTILKAVLERTDMKQKFANTMCDLMDGAFSTENALSVVEALIERSDNECFYALENGYTSTWANKDTFADSRQQIRDFAERRPSVITNYLAKQFGYEGTKYNVEFYNPTGAKSTLNSQTLTSSGSVSASYFTECTAVLKTDTYDGYEFSYWLVNGKKHTNKDLYIYSNMADADGNVVIQLYLNKTDADRTVTISELYTSGEGDWIEIYNPTENDINLSGYYLSDDELDFEKYRLTSLVVPAGETVVVVCKNNNETSALKRQQTNFSLKTGETLYFSDNEGNVLSEVAVVNMEEDQSLSLGVDGRYHIGTVTEMIHIEG